MNEKKDIKSWRGLTFPTQGDEYLFLHTMILHRVPVTSKEKERYEELWNKRGDNFEFV